MFVFCSMASRADSNIRDTIQHIVGDTLPLESITTVASTDADAREPKVLRRVAIDASFLARE